MKAKTFLLSLLCAGSAATQDLRIDPTDWYAGLRDTRLQLMVSGQGIGTADVSMEAYPGATIESVVRGDSPNYLFIYMNLDGAQAGTLHLTFTQGKKKTRADYTLRKREKAGEERVGFSCADVLYMLMPDRFARGGDGTDVKMKTAYTVDRTAPSLRHGGNLEGVREHLDYLTDLGVTALWFTPVLENDSPDNNGQSTYHGYATTDYYRVDPRFGSNEDYRRLCDEAHAKGLKVVMDMIFNHCGYEHPWVADPPTSDWFNTPEWLTEGEEKYVQTSYKLTPVLDPYASRVDLRETVDGWFVPSMPDLNQRNPHVMRYLIQNSIWWIETVGIDGIRMDTYPYADRRGMASWMAALEREYPNFNTVGETWVTEPAYTAAWQRGSRLSEIDSHLRTVMDFSFYDKINQAVNEETDAWWQGYNRIYNSLVYDYLYETPEDVMAFIENHDTDRFLRNGQNLDALRQAVSLLLTMRRTPQLYYGTEVMMNGTKEVTDGHVRKDFPGGFAGDERNLFDASQRTRLEADCYEMHRKLLHWRRDNQTIINGRQVQFCPVNGVYVLARIGQKTVLTILNGADEKRSIPLSRYAELLPATPVTARDILTDSRVSLDPNGTLSLPSRGTLVLEF